MYVATGQQNIDVNAKSIVPQIDKPQLGTTIHSQAEVGHKTSEANSATSSSIPKSEVGLSNKQGGVLNSNSAELN